MTSGAQYALTKIWPRFYTSKALDASGQLRTESAPILTVSALDIACAISGVGSMTAQCRVTQHLSSTIAGVGTFTATLRTKESLALVVAGASTFAAQPRIIQHLSLTVSGVGTMFASLHVPSPIVEIPPGAGPGRGISLPYRRPFEKKPKRVPLEARIARKWLAAHIAAESDVTATLQVHLPLKLRAISKSEYDPNLFFMLSLPAFHVTTKSRFRAKVPRLQDSFYSDDEADLENALQAILML